MRPPIPLLLRAFVTFCALLAAAPSARATVPHGPVPRTTGEIHVDGTLDEPTWATALPIDIGYEIKPADNGPAPVRGVCLLAYDEGRLYIGFRALDAHPAQIRAHVADRDSVFRNDIVGIVLEPFRDGRRGFSFMVNPLGVQIDAMLDDVGGLTEDYTWDAVRTAPPTARSPSRCRTARFRTCPCGSRS